MGTASQSLKRVIEALTAARVCSIILYVFTVMWLIFRVSQATFFGAYVLALPFNLKTVMINSLIVVLLYSELSKIIRHDYDASDALAILVFTLMSVGFWGRDQYVLLYDLLLILAMRNEDFRRLSWLCAITLSFCIVVVVGSSQLGIITDYMSFANDRIRHYLGFTYCLVAPQLFFVVIVTVCYLRDWKISWLELIVLGGIDVVLYSLTDSRLSFVLGIVVLCISVVRKLGHNATWWRPLAKLSSWSFIVGFAISAIIIAIWAYQIEVGERWLSALNINLGGRLGLTYDGLQTFGIKPFGQIIPWIGNGLDVFGNNDPTGYNYIDNLFFHALIDQGVVYTVLYMALFTAVSRKAASKGDYMFVLMLAVVAAHFIIDDTMLGLESNTFMFAFGSYLIGPKAQKNLLSKESIPEHTLVG